MENIYYRTVTNTDVDDIIKVMDISKDTIIAIDDEDIRQTLTDAVNAVIIEGCAYGNDKVAKAIAQIDSLACMLIADKLYTAQKILFCIESDPKADIIMEEMKAVCDFCEKFSLDVDVIWGMTRRSLNEPNTVAIKLLATNINS